MHSEIIIVGVTDSTFGVSNITNGSNCDSTAVIETVANYSCHFDHWSNGSTANPDTITLTGDSTVMVFAEMNIVKKCIFASVFNE